ncbi:MAG TPA: MFS transporter [Deltaproteobacteria bacterium]|jgi:MFS family permease|nr:MFS transporter [Deltaproteobacteria bacterium]HIJ75133.1 MFS transporter [Deltaproteobacteria bacterium]
MAILSKDGSILFITRMVRLFAYGSLSVILLIYLAQIGLSDTQIGLLLTLTLLGDTIISLWLTTRADCVGRRRMLLAGAGLMVFGGTLFALTTSYAVLLIAAIIGVISPSGYEVGPFLSIEQSALSNIIPDEKRTQIFAWYNLAGLFTTALGAIVTGILVQLLENAHITPVASYRTIIVGYAALGFLLAALFCALSPLVEVPVESSCEVPSEFRKRFGLHRSKSIVFKLSALFSLDAFAGGFILQSILAYWFYKRFGVQPALLGSIFFGANILAGVSSLSASWMASRIGLVKTMVYTHIPSNILLMLVPLMPNLPLAITVLLLRFSISQMDVPTRQSYVMAVVEPDERSAAAGITGVARTVGASFSPVLAGPLLASATLASIPFFISGSLKIIYDLLLYRSFQAIRAPEESE